ncbi:MAG TPA: hypothetical protein DCP90_08950 [Clostridiales bacterium]|nr:MAG: hypothetical protein A2Y22_02720 [Clostridiales bacterium GWD2_32_59]HAN10721.1 hypothetical protein [Clostridiales bacterium]
MNNVKIIINEWDPIGVISYAPENTYDQEIKIVCKYLKDVSSTEQLAERIYETFVKQFGTNIFNKKSEECLSVASKIMSTIKM